MSWYVASFGGAGVLIGGTRALWSGKVSLFMTLAIGGAIVMNGIAIADGGFRAWRAGDEWIAMTAIGMCFGIAAAYGATKRA